MGTGSSTMATVDFAYMPVIGRGEQVRLLCAENGVDVNETWTAELDKSKLPFGTVPYLKDGSVELNDSMAIVQYIVTKYPGPATPTSTETAALALDMWAWCQDYYGFVLSPYHDIAFAKQDKFGRNLRLTDTRPDGDEAAISDLAKLHHKRLAFLEKRVASSASKEYLAGEFTYADLFLFTCVRAVQECKAFDKFRNGGATFVDYPVICAICDRVGNRDAVKRAGKDFSTCPV